AGDAPSMDAPDRDQENDDARPDHTTAMDGALDLPADREERADLGTPTLAQGEPCSKDEACASGHCVDGVCCENGCDGTCMACSLAKTGKQSGSCAFVLKETDPDKECVALTFCCS